MMCDCVVYVYVYVFPWGLYYCKQNLPLGTNKVTWNWTWTDLLIKNVLIC